jgi:hypothetical protein
MFPDYLPRLIDLSKWIDNQRRFYFNVLNGKKNQLSDERIRLLMQAGFDFGSQNTKPFHFKSWTDKISELKEFKEK